MRFTDLLPFTLTPSVTLQPYVDADEFARRAVEPRRWAGQGRKFQIGGLAGQLDTAVTADSGRAFYVVPL